MDSRKNLSRFRPWSEKPAATEMLTVEFGGWSPRGLRYGMVELDGQKWIFEFPAIVHDRLMSYFNIHESPAGRGANQCARRKPAANAPTK